MRLVTILSLIVTLLLTTGLSAGIEAGCYGSQPNLKTSAPAIEDTELLELSTISVLVY